MKHIIILMGLFTFFNAHAQIERVEPPFLVGRNALC